MMKAICPPRYHHNGFVAGSSCTWTHDMQLHFAGTNKPKSAQPAKQGL